MSMFNKAKDAALPKDLTPEQVITAFANMTVAQAQATEDMKTMMKTVSDLSGVVTNLAKASQSQQTPDDKDKKATAAAATPPTTEEDLEAMSNAQLASHISKDMLEGVKELLAGQSAETSKAVEAVAASQRGSAVAQQMKDIAATDGSKDFWDWQEDIAALHKAGSSTKPDVLYREARAANPERALALDKQYEQNGQTKDENADQGDVNDPKNVLKGLFGGMSPSSGGDDTESAEEFDSAIEAGEAAFDEAFEGLPEHIYSA